MTINAATIGADWFLNGLANLQSREMQTQQQLSSGYAVSSAADDPVATRQLVDLGSSLASAQTYQTTLGNVQAEASAADDAISSAIALVQSAQSLATQGASSTASAGGQQYLAIQAQAIQQQMVSLANTTVAGQYIFGGDNGQSPPYQYDSSSATGVDALTGAPSTSHVENPAGQTVYQSLTAGTIFDPSLGGISAAGNTFAALQSLVTALSSNNTAGVGAALSSLDSASSWLTQQQVHYGSTEQTLTSEQNRVSVQITSIQTDISGIRDANIAQDATELTQDATSQQATMAAQAQMPQKSLFDYLA